MRRWASCALNAGPLRLLLPFKPPAPARPRAPASPVKTWRVLARCCKKTMTTLGQADNARSSLARGTQVLCWALTQNLCLFPF